MGVSARSCWLSLHPEAISGWSTSSSLIWFPQATPQAAGGLSGPLCLPGGLPPCFWTLFPQAALLSC